MENVALKQQENIFYKAMQAVNYANSLNHKHVCNYLGMDQYKIFNSDFYFVAWENASKKYLKNN